MEEHPNVSLLKRFNPRNIAECAGILTEDFVWHFFNPLLPEIQGDYVGLEGLQSFFDRLAAQTQGTFQVQPFAVTPVGDELLIVQSKNTMTQADRKIEVLAVVVWRVVNGRLSEAWDIPAVHTAKTKPA